MTVFVTGASGHLGANLVRALLERGERVRVLVRRGSNNAALEGLPVERAEGDLGGDAPLEPLLDGCDRLYHVAAMVSIRDIDREALYRCNVLATRRILAAARRVGVKKAVHCSSFGAVGSNPDGPSDESHQVSPFEPMMAYEQTKVFAEHEVLRAAVDGLDVCIVNPSGMIGPWDYKPSMIGRTITDFARGKLLAYVPGAFDWVPVADVAAGHIAAMDKGKAGQRYLLTGTVHTLAEILGWLSEELGRPPPRIAIPGEVAARFASAKDWLQSRLMPEHHPAFNEASIRLLLSGKSGNNRRAREELDWSHRPLRQAVCEHVQWLREHGSLSRPDAS